jgi:hypothetical protein
VEQAKQEAEDKRRLAEEARGKAEQATCRRLELEGKLAAGRFAQEEPGTRCAYPESASTADPERQRATTPPAPESAPNA